jgi:hypothetical protein
MVGWKPPDADPVLEQAFEHGLARELHEALVHVRPG